MTGEKETQVAPDAYEVRPVSNGVELYVRGLFEGFFASETDARLYMDEPVAKKPRKKRFASGARA